MSLIPWKKIVRDNELTVPVLVPYRTVQNQNNEMKTLLLVRITVPYPVPVPYQNNDLRYYSYDILDQHTIMISFKNS